MNELKPCPLCGGKITHMHTEHHNMKHRTHDFTCKDCGAHFFLPASSEYQSAEGIEAEAAKLFNRRAAPENKPLALDELRKMCKPTMAQLQQTEPYAPVWIVTLENKKISCQITRGLIKVDNRCKPPREYIDAHMVGLLLSDYGKTWLSYARKLECNGCK